MANKELEKLEKDIAKAEGNLAYYKRQIGYLEAIIPQWKKQLEELKALPVKPKKTREPLKFPIRILPNAFLDEQASFPQRFGGSDYGVEGKVIAQKGSKKLVWFKGHSGWSGRGQTSYYGGSLFLLGETQEKTFAGNYEDGNTLKESLSKNDELIKEFLGIGFSLLEYYKPKTTVVIEDLKL